MLAFAEVGEQGLDRLFRVALPAPQPAQGCINDYAVQPGAKLRLPLELAYSFKGGQKYLLHRIVGIFFVAQHAPGYEQEPPTVDANARFKRIAVTGLHPRQQGRLVRARPKLAE